MLQLAYSEAGWETVRHAPPSTDAHVDCTRWQVKARRLNTVRASSDRHETVVIQTPAWCHLEFETQHNLHNTTFSIGRDESNDLVYDNQHISNMHCMLTRGASGAPPVLKDTSTNGILVDGLRVCKGAAVQLTWGQRVELINFGLIGGIRDTSMCFVVQKETSGQRTAELEKEKEDLQEKMDPRIETS